MVSTYDYKKKEQFVASSRYTDFRTFNTKLNDTLNRFNTLFRTDNTGQISEDMKDIIANMMVLYASIPELTLEELQTPGLYQKLDTIQDTLSKIINGGDETAWAITRQCMFQAYHAPIDHHQITVLWAMPLTEDTKKIHTKEILNTIIIELTQNQSNTLVLTGFPPEINPLDYIYAFEKLEDHQLDVLISSDISSMKRKEFINIKQKGPKNPWWKREYLKTRHSDGTETYISPLEFLDLLKDLEPHQVDILKNLPKRLPNGQNIHNILYVLKYLFAPKNNEAEQQLHLHFSFPKTPDLNINEVKKTIKFLTPIITSSTIHIIPKNMISLTPIDENGTELGISDKCDLKKLGVECAHLLSEYPYIQIIGNLDAETLRKNDFDFKLLNRIKVKGDFICTKNNTGLPHAVTGTLDLSKLSKGCFTRDTKLPSATIINFGHCLTSLSVLITETKTKDNKTETHTILPTGIKKIIVEPARLRRGTDDFAIAKKLLELYPELEIIDTNENKFTTELPKKIEPIKPKLETKLEPKVVELPIKTEQDLDYVDLVNILGSKFPDVDKIELDRMIRRASNSYKVLKTETRLRDGEKVTCVTTTQTETERKTETLTETVIKRVQDCITDIINTNEKHKEQKQRQAKTTLGTTSKQTKNSEKSTPKTLLPIIIKKYISWDLLDEIEQCTHNIDEILRNINEINVDPFNMNRYGMRYAGPITIIKNSKEETAKWIEKRPGACLVQSPAGPLASNDKRIVWSIGKNEKGELIIVCKNFCKTHNEQYTNAREKASVKDRVYTEQELKGYVDIDEWINASKTQANSIQTFMPLKTRQLRR